MSECFNKKALTFTVIILILSCFVIFNHNLTQGLWENSSSSSATQSSLPMTKVNTITHDTLTKRVEVLTKDFIILTKVVNRLTEQKKNNLPLSQVKTNEVENAKPKLNVEEQTKLPKDEEKIKPQTQLLTDEECPSSKFLEAIQHGKWVTRTPRSGELEEVMSFLHDARTEYFHMPPTLQRPDGKCGGETDFLGTSRIRFRALCEPNGTTPCCFQNQCVNKTVAECKCPDCLDMRSRLHANFASWELDEYAYAGCKIPLWNDKKSVCDLLKGLTIQVMGDSYLMQIFLSLMSAVRGGGNLWRPGVTDSVKQSCRGERVYVNHCRKNAVTEGLAECDGSVSIKLIYGVRIAWQLVDVLIGKPNTILVLGYGLHDGFNFPRIRDNAIEPLLKRRGNSSWPKIVWFTPHVPGLLKSKSYTTQRRELALKYADQMMPFLKGKLPNVDTRAFTEGVVSYDGTHYGKPINDLKVRILLTLLDKNKKQGWAEIF